MPRPISEPLKPMFPYKGSKWRLSQSHYPEPQYDTIIEPFAGSGCFSLVHHFCGDSYRREIILVDKNPSIISIWDLLKSLDESAYERLPPNFIYVPDNLSHSERALLSRWTTRGDARPRLRMSNWAGEYPNQFWCPAIRQRLVEQAPFIRHWNISHGDYRDLGNMEATWFIDAPYQCLPRLYEYGADLNYQELAKWVQSRLGQVIVCEGGNANWLPFRPLKEGRLRNGQSKGGSLGPSEVVWYRSGSRRVIIDMGARL